MIDQYIFFPFPHSTFIVQVRVQHWMTDLLDLLLGPDVGGVSIIVLCKMFSRWFFANKKLIMAIRTLKFGDVTYNVMS